MTNPGKVAFNLFGKDIYWYALIMVVAIFVAVIIAHLESKRKNMPKDTAIDLCLCAVPFGIIFARLYYVLFDFETYLHNPISVLYIWNGGLAIPGAVLGGLLAVFIYSRVKKLRFLQLTDIIAPGLVLAQAIGRWGNFFNQEAYGVEITNPAHLWFPLGVRIDHASGIPTYHYATFFYESMWCVLVFGILWSLRKKFKHDGDVFLAYLGLYSLERMFVEQLRTDSLMLGSMRVTQILCILVFVSVAVFWCVRYMREAKLGQLIWPAPLAEIPMPAEPDLVAPVDDSDNSVGEFAADEGDFSEFGIERFADESDEPLSEGEFEAFLDATDDGEDEEND